MSMRTLRPSLQPNRCSSFTKAATTSCASGSLSDKFMSTPTRRVFCCCALAANGHAAAAPPSRVMNWRRFTAHHLLRSTDQTHCGCDVDCHATNFHPSGVLVQTLRNLSRRLRGWPLISASIAAPPVTSAASPIMRTLRSVKLALFYLVLPEVIDSSQVALVSVMAEERV